MRDVIFGAYQEFIADRDVKTYLTETIFLPNRHDEPL